MTKRCRYSDYGLKWLRPRGGQRLGWIIGLTKNGHRRHRSLKVLWDGLKTIQLISPDFIEEIHEQGICEVVLGLVAQPAEQATFNGEVGGSSPPESTIPGLGLADLGDLSFWPRKTLR